MTGHSEACGRCGGVIRRVFGHSSHVCPRPALVAESAPTTAKQPPDKAARARCLAGSATDEDRIALATRKGDVMVGPVECQRCQTHPRRRISLRWSWPAPVDGDQLAALQGGGDADETRGCAECQQEPDQ